MGLISFFIASGAAACPPIGGRAGVIHPGTDEDRRNGKNKDAMVIQIEAIVGDLGSLNIQT
ncbi:hypothetical protein F1880_008857 [Penicillium rolfsii]|nr:hypothetical protein F1880_008857 [Penicillium rolfsii]